MIQRLQSAAKNPAPAGFFAGAGAGWLPQGIVIPAKAGI